VCVKCVSFGVLAVVVQKLESSTSICHGYVLMVILLSIYFCTAVSTIIQKLQCIAVEIFRQKVVVNCHSENDTTNIPTHICVKFRFWFSTNLCPL
jgi:hypothetical protein